jgi:hypothetical protein
MPAHAGERTWGHPWDRVIVTTKENLRAALASARVASIVEHRSEPGFVLLLQLADLHFRDPGFEDPLAESLRSESRLIELWATWSADQRWTPSAYVEGTDAGWFDGQRRHVRAHPDDAAAVADFIHRMAAWLSRREVIKVDG